MRWIYLLISSLIICFNITMEPSFKILIDKSERKLFLYKIVANNELLVKTFDVSLGFNPIGTKLKEGDGATPEGEYYITHKNSKSKFYLSLGISYPNANDAEIGLKTNLITKKEYNQILKSISKNKLPLQNTNLGGDIFIHGGGTGKLFGENKDWTWGCVALENDDIKGLFDTIPVNTPVKIIP